MSIHSKMRLCAKSIISHPGQGILILIILFVLLFDGVVLGFEFPFEGHELLIGFHFRSTFTRFDQGVEIFEFRVQLKGKSFDSDLFIIVGSIKVDVCFLAKFLYIFRLRLEG